jgi:hypothetical protein
MGACNSPDSASSLADTLTGTFALSGAVTFDRAPALTRALGGNLLDYSHLATLPARRILVQAIDVSSGRSVAQALTDDLGRYTLQVPAGRSVKVRALAISRVSAAAPDGTAPDHCNGASWDIEVVDNTRSKAGYALEDGTVYSAAGSAGTTHAPLTFRSGAYTNRAAAPFALLDTMLKEVEMLCEAYPSVSLPLLYVNWSAGNVNVSGDLAAGQIGTSFYQNNSGQSELYLLGRADVDTDEYDEHVVAHEFGHFVDDRVYRSDIHAGAHVIGSNYGDTLDPTCAFGEGFASAMAAFALNDPVYVDTTGPGQAGGWEFSAATAPTGDDRGVFSERSSLYMLYSLWHNRAPQPSFDRIHDILYNYERTGPAYKTIQTLAAYYNQVYGKDAEGLFTLWDADLNSDYNALCPGNCSGSSDTADPFDLDNDMGVRYNAQSYKYREALYGGGGGTTMPAEFWRLYRTLGAGANSPTDHDQMRFGGYTASSGLGDKFGMTRWYRFVAASARATVTVSSPTDTSSAPVSCSTDVLNLVSPDFNPLRFQWGWYDYTKTGATAGCPAITRGTLSGNIYVFMLSGVATELGGYTINLSL